MLFLVQELFKSFVFFSRKKRIGFVFEGKPLPYNAIMASTRLRVYDVILSFAHSSAYFLEMYKPWKTYDVVIFQKKFDAQAFELATRLKQRGTKIVLDINVNYFDPSWLDETTMYQHEDIKRFVEMVDAVIVTTDFLKNYLSERYPILPVYTIEESIPNKFIEFLYHNPMTDRVVFVYNGYAVKASEVLLIRDVLERLATEHALTYLFICEKDPKITFRHIETVFVPFDQAQNEKQLARGHIFLSPRDLSNPYNLGHSFTKVGTPMAVGLPVVASPISSYRGSPAILIDDFGDGWYRELKRLITDRAYFEDLSRHGKHFCRDHFSPAVIKKKYQVLFESL